MGVGGTVLFGSIYYRSTVSLIVNTRLLHTDALTARSFYPWKGRFSDPPRLWDAQNGGWEVQ